MSVLSSDTIAASPAQNYGDLLRSVPGVNVIQTSARDVNLTSRQGTSTLSNSQLVLVDGRSVYLDFFGIVLWDFLPTNLSDVKQIEVIRGPASAVWGANAVTGVVNIVTKSPREAPGTTGSISAAGLRPRCRVDRRQGPGGAVRQQRQRSRAVAKRSVVVPAVGRLFQVRGVCPPERRHSAHHRSARSDGDRGRRHVSRRWRRPARHGLPEQRHAASRKFDARVDQEIERRPHHRTRAASPDRTASFTPASARSISRRARTMGTEGLATTTARSG